MSAPRAPRSVRAALLALIAATMLVSNSCSSGGGKNSASATGSEAVATPNADLSGAGPTTTFAQKQVQSQTVETPDAALEAGAANVVPADYTPSPGDESIVVQATTANVRIYHSATDTDVWQTLDNPLPSGAPLTLLVDGQTSTRYKVLLPIRPNGSVGWVEPADVGLKTAHKYRVEVDMGAFRIKVFNGTEQLMDEQIGIGTDETPTPNGRYYIKELLKPPDPNGIYGPYAYGLSGFSPVLQSFNGKGDGTIGIHGTNHPDLLGKKVSHGCIRMSNEAITKLTKYLPLGTPVIIKA